MESLKKIFQAPATGGILLLLTAILAIIVANSPLGPQYEHILHSYIGSLSVAHWVNDVLMAIFFLGVGFEVKHEMLEGELNTNAKRLLPTIAAVFGVLMPALIFAFSIGIISLLGSRVPLAAKVFLTTLAVVDDLIAVIIIAAVYTPTLEFMYLGWAVLVFVLLLLLNKKEVVSPWPYIILGVALWLCIFNSGLHATLSGVILAMAIPSKVLRNGKELFPLNDWHEALGGWITFLIIPLFGFANAGVSFGDFQWSELMHPVILGISLGLFAGKQIGIFGIMLILVKTRIVPMPKPLTWKHIYGVSLCCGVGFTMSLFVNLLAFPPGHAQEIAKVGIFLGSIVSGVSGYIMLRFFTPEVKLTEPEDPFFHKNHLV